MDAKYLLQLLDAEVVPSREMHCSSAVGFRGRFPPYILIRLSLNSMGTEKFNSYSVID